MHVGLHQKLGVTMCMVHSSFDLIRDIRSQELGT